MDVKDAQFLVIDFETTTPKGYPPEPIELGLVKVFGMEVDKKVQRAWFIKPPAHAPLTQFDIVQTGITQKDLDGARSSAEVFDILEDICGRQDYIFIAQNAKYEQGIIKRFSEGRPKLASRRFIDTIPLAKHAIPHLTNYKLDNLASILKIAIPADRHRALADCVITGLIFSDLIKRIGIVTLDELYQIAEVQSKKITLVKKDPQMTLFDDDL